MINEKNIFLTVSWLSGLLSAEIFISTGEWGVQMQPLTSENSYFLRSGPQGATLLMTGLCAGNSPGTGEFPAQMASYAENVSIWWRHHVLSVRETNVCKTWFTAPTEATYGTPYFERALKEHQYVDE